MFKIFESPICRVKAGIQQIPISYDNVRWRSTPVDTLGFSVLVFDGVPLSFLVFAFLSCVCVSFLSVPFSVVAEWKFFPMNGLLGVHGPQPALIVDFNRRCSLFFLYTTV